MIFKDREEAALLLLKKLQKYKGQNPVVLGVPRGAIPMARIIAEGLNGEMSAILVHKISAPINNEFAIGSIGFSGKIHRTSDVKLLNISESYIQTEAKKQLRMLKQRSKKYGLAPLEKNKIVIIVDDGIATGATLLAAIFEVRIYNPKKLIVAAAVAAKSTANEIRKLVDELILLDEPETFFGVSQFFEYFPQVTDADAIMLLHHKPIVKKTDPEISPYHDL